MTYQGLEEGSIRLICWLDAHRMDVIRSVMMVGFVGFWFETDWILMKLCIPAAVGPWLWEWFERWRRTSGCRHSGRHQT